MAEGDEDKSMLYKLKPVIDRLPAVVRPEGHVHFRTKMTWVVFILVLYFAMTNIVIYGLSQEGGVDLFAQYRAILAGAQFSLMHLGIGPIVTGSIIMQLFTGAKIIKLNLKNDEDKAVYQGTQKMLVLIMIVVESVPQVYGFMVPSEKFIGGMDGVWADHGDQLAKFVIVLQLIVGSYLVFLMDEVVSKWGIGSGISLFIAAGVAQQIFTGSLNWHPVDNTAPISIDDNPPAGTIPKTIYLFHHMSASQLSGGGYERIFLAQPNPMVALIGTIAIFLFVAYTESSRIELPLAHGGARGARGRYPIKLIYASNIPVILMAALLANVSMFSMLFWSHPSFQNVPLLGGNWMLGYYSEGATRPDGGLAYYLSTVNGLGDWLLPMLSNQYLDATGLDKTRLQIGIHVIVYVIIMILGSILFARFWIETTNMGPEAVATQIESSGMQIPGFRRDPRVLKRVLERYIPVVTIISGATVGGLAAGADLIGTVGNASGTGVLLAVGIMIQLYDAIGREQMMEMHPVLRGFFGGE
ncbi:MAG: preprotein translocase subunit SecY [Euryarchaeota archaeon RBG_19FT_COMBO_56_21]|nr:MAG: preprotein translocase subunit SecY [Euryarchaeota archaeon RBG_19FT_COMBO_56_21]